MSSSAVVVGGEGEVGEGVRKGGRKRQYHHHHVSPTSTPDGKYKVGDYVYFETRQPGVVHFGIIANIGKNSADVLLYETDFNDFDGTARPLWDRFVKRIQKRYEWLHAVTKEKQELIKCPYNCIISRVIDV